MRVEILYDTLYESHGVGVCQIGLDAQTRQNENFAQILRSLVFVLPAQHIEAVDLAFQLCLLLFLLLGDNLALQVFITCFRHSKLTRDCEHMAIEIFFVVIGIEEETNIFAFFDGKRAESTSQILLKDEVDRQFVLKDNVTLDAGGIDPLHLEHDDGVALAIVDLDDAQHANHLCVAPLVHQAEALVRQVNVHVLVATSQGVVLFCLGEPIILEFVILFDASKAHETTRAAEA